jgi:hypothetical protein
VEDLAALGLIATPVVQVHAIEKNEGASGADRAAQRVRKAPLERIQVDIPQMSGPDQEGR